MQYLFEQGHRRVLTLTCLRRETLYARLDGIKEAYRHFHVAFDPQRDLLVTEWFTADEAERALDAWLLSHDRSQWPEVIFPNSTSMTEGGSGRCATRAACSGRYFTDHHRFCMEWRTVWKTGHGRHGALS
jgi:DNA-binding LacI/PurR family transcriptional regulator